MKAIQITVDERLLSQLDADTEVQRLGRSAVLRRAAADYLRRRQQQAIAEQYRRAYAGGDGLGSEFEDWEQEAVWPSE
jgi:metal-responsive CopG/Arc/MetJ family transcriptional regulator